MGPLDAWNEAYLAAFLIGLASTVGMLALGAGHHGHAHAHVGHHGHGHAHAATHNAGAASSVLAWLVPLLNVSSLLALAMWGGAAGYVARRLGVSDGKALLAAVLVGLTGAWLLAAVIRAMTRAEAGVVVAVDPIGTSARVIAAIAPGAVGEIVFARDGKRQALPARLDESDAHAIDRDVEVLVMRVERGVAYVRRASELLSTSPTKEGREP